MEGYFLGSQIGSIKSLQTVGGSQQTSMLFGRVINIVLDETSEIYDNKGNRLPIGAIVYRNITAEKGATATEGSALPIQSSIKQFPLLNEIVGLVQGPTSNIQSSVDSAVMYYSSVVNLWGSSHHNAIPEPNTDISTLLGKGVKELADINPMYPFPGDILIEGRQGQSIRVGGNSSLKNPLVDSSNNGKPYILISNGQIKTDNGIDPIIEDINKDPNSIYFVSDHIVPLTAASTKVDSYNIVPTALNRYKGNQVVLTGGRLVLNAKEDSILLSSKEAIGLSANTINLDSEDYFCVDAKSIYLGKAARQAKIKEPVVLGVQLENWLTTLLTSLDKLSYSLESATSVSGGPVPQLNQAAYPLRAAVKSLRTQIKQFQSKKVYTE